MTPVRGVIGIFVLVTAVLCAGCGGKGESLSKQQQQDSARLGEIGKRTGGDWNKATPDERHFLIGLGYGSESSAKMILYGAAGKPIGQAGGPPGAAK